MKKKIIMSIMLLFIIVGLVFFVKEKLEVSNIPSSLETAKKVWSEQKIYKIEELNKFSYENAVDTYEERYIINIQNKESTTEFVMIDFNSVDEAGKVYNNIKAYKNNVFTMNTQIDLWINKFYYSSFKINDKYISLWQKGKHVIYVASENKNNMNRIKSFILSQQW